jgi:hypothetical protein
LRAAQGGYSRAVWAKTAAFSCFRDGYRWTTASAQPPSTPSLSARSASQPLHRQRIAKIPLIATKTRRGVQRCGHD